MLRDIPFFTACTANVQGLARRPLKLSPYYSFVHRTPSCVYVLTETNLESTSPALLHNPPPTSVNLITTRATSKTLGSGVTVLLNRAIQLFSPPVVLIQGYVTYLCICLGRYRVHIYAVYAPPATTPGNRALATQICDTIRSHALANIPSHDPLQHIIILGDLNATLRPLDKGSGRGPTPLDRQWADLMHALHLRDSVTHVHPTTPQYTLIRTHTQSTPDHILLSTQMLPALRSVRTEHGQLKKGDHAPLHAILGQQPAKHQHKTPVQPPKPNLPPPFLSAPTFGPNARPNTSGFGHHFTRVPLHFLEEKLLSDEISSILAQWPPPAPNATPQAVYEHYDTLLTTISHYICHFTANEILHEKRKAQGLQRELRTLYSTPAANDEHASILSLLEKRYQLELTAIHQTQVDRQTSFINKVADVIAPVANHYAQARAAKNLQATDRVVPELLHPITGFAQTDTPGKLEAAHIFYSRLFQRPVEGPIYTHPNDTRDTGILPDISTSEYNSLFENLPHLTQTQTDALLAPPHLN